MRIGVRSKTLEIDLGTTKNLFAASDLPPKGSPKKKGVFSDLDLGTHVDVLV